MKTFEERHEGLKGKSVSYPILDDSGECICDDGIGHKSIERFNLSSRVWEDCWKRSYPEKDIDATQIDKETVRELLNSGKFGRGWYGDNSKQLLKDLMEELGL